VRNRPLHAVLLSGTGDAHRLLEPLREALNGSGPALLPLDAAQPAARLRELIAAFDPNVVVDADGEARVRSAASALRIAPETAVIIGTSGSTGAPKGVELSAAALEHSARASLSRVGARPGDRWLCCLPASHVAGLQVLVRSLVSGTDPVVAPAATAAVLAGSGCAHVSLVPTQLIRLLDENASGGDKNDGDKNDGDKNGDGAAALAGFGSVLVGGAAAGAAVLERARAAGVAVRTTYGMSETCGGCVYDGVTLDGVSVKVGADGVIRLSGPVLFDGYVGDPELTARVLRDGWLRTPDLGRLRPDGRLDVIGRADDVTVSGGVNIALPAVERRIQAMAEVAQCAVVATPDPEWGHRVVAHVVPAPGALAPSLGAVRDFVAVVHPRSWAPRELVVEDRLPLLESGKIDRAKLCSTSALKPRP
jgi:O-succinylbenzoic acid--CoA ligase